VATSTTRLMTFEEFEQIPNPPGGAYELHHGELVEVRYPQFPHVRAQWQLRQLLQAAAGDAGRVHTEFPYRPLPEYEGWRADVVYLSKERWDGIDRYFSGAPELVVEVLSPSNKTAELHEKRKLCLENGSREFWVVNTDLRQIEITTPDGHSTIYKSGQKVALFFGGELNVSEVFA